MYTIGLTGGIGSGKSTIADLFRARNVPVFDTDIIARQVVAPGQPALEEICSTFGAGLLLEDGTLNRRQLRDLVFNDNSAHNRLEAIMHPRIRAELLKQISSCKSAYCIAVIPLLVEKNWQSIVDRVLVVDTTEQLQVERATRRDQLTPDLVKGIMHKQVDREIRLQVADDVIDNTSTLESLEAQVNLLHKNYLELSKSRSADL